jgi:hypothetical protein
MFTDHLKIDPLPVLVESCDPALIYSIHKDILQETQTPQESLWDLPECVNILDDQLENGSWRYKGNRSGDQYGENYELLETWRKLNNLVEKYGIDKSHPAVSRAAEFIFSCQTDEGDIRGILSNQYMPYYMGVILEVLIKAGYAFDERVIKGLEWLLKMRQHDGGWIIPLMMYKMQTFYKIYDQPPIPPDKKKPFSHVATGMVIRAFVEHPEYKKKPEIILVGNLLKGRLFKKDAYSSRQAVSYWYKLQFPFWWTNILTVLDSLAKLGFDKGDQVILKAIHWLIENQSDDGLWHASIGPKKHANEWITLAVCRTLKYYL